MTLPAVWRALTQPGFLRSSLPWRSAGYLLLSGVVGLLLCVGLVLTTAIAGVLAVALVGLVLLAALALVGIPFAALERRLLRLLGNTPAPNPHREPAYPGLPAWLRTRVREQATWRELGFTMMAAFILWPIDLLAVGSAIAIPLHLMAAPFRLAQDGEVKILKAFEVHSPALAIAVGIAGIVLLVLSAYPITVLAGGRAALARMLIAPTAQEHQVGDLISSRARLVDAFEAERRRIERDLHDGAQQRLVALAMTLGLARLDAPKDGPLAAQLAAAHREAQVLLSDLRELINGIHPQVLTDRGLPDACADAADRSPIPVEVNFQLSGRLSPAVESASYFVVSEALANIAKHSGAQTARVDGRYERGILTIEMTDDGHGGADPSNGTGLIGLADRVSVVDGTLTIHSPVGGPTLLRLEIPCIPL